MASVPLWMCMPSASGQHLQSNSQVHMNTVCMPKFIRQHTNTVSHPVLCTHTHTHSFSSLFSEGVTVSCWVKVRQMALTVGIQYQWPRAYDHSCVHAGKHTTHIHARTRKHRHLKVFLKQTHPQSKRRSSAHLTSRQSHKQHCTCIFKKHLLILWFH